MTKYFIANWKQNKNQAEAIQWADDLISLINTDSKLINALNSKKIEIIVCPSSPLISVIKNKLSSLNNLSLGSQDVSKFTGGRHTGEIGAKTLSDLVKYTIVGHSERRAQGETENDIESKIIQLQKYQIEPILCIGGEKDKIYNNISFLAYEPVESIGTGNNLKLNEVLKMKKRLNLKSSTKFIYGGSVSSLNIGEYLGTNEIDGLLIGNASLDPKSFYNIVAKI